MYDTIRAYCLGELASADRIKDKLQNSKITIDEGGVVSKVEGCLQSMRVAVRGGYVTIEGSLPRYLYGDNFHTISRADTQKAINDISAALGIQANLWKVTRLDIATILSGVNMGELVNCLGDVSRCTHWNNRGTLYWRNKAQKKTKELCIYDKTNWAKEKGFDVPTPLKGLEWVRAEMRLFGTGVKTEYKEDVYLSSLYDEGFYYFICKEWEKHFISIKKGGCLIEKKEGQTANEAFNHLFATMVEMNKDKFENLLKQELENCGDKQRRAQFKRKVEGCICRNRITSDETQKAYSKFQRMIKQSRANH